MYSKVDFSIALVNLIPLSVYWEQADLGHIAIPPELQTK